MVHVLDVHLNAFQVRATLLLLLSLSHPVALSSSPLLLLISSHPLTSPRLLRSLSSPPLLASSPPQYLEANATKLDAALNQADQLLAQPRHPASMLY